MFSLIFTKLDKTVIISAFNNKLSIHTKPKILKIKKKSGNTKNKNKRKQKQKKGVFENRINLLILRESFRVSPNQKALKKQKLKIESQRERERERERDPKLMLEKREFLVNTGKCFWKTQKTNLEILNLEKHIKSYKYKSLIYMKKKKEPEVIRTVPVFLGES